MEKTLMALVDNGPEALLRVTGLLRRKGLKMKKISMEECKDVSFAYLTITLGDNNKAVEQIIHHMQKLVDVHEVKEVVRDSSGEVLLFKTGRWNECSQARTAH